MSSSNLVAILTVTSLVLCQGCNTDDASNNALSNQAEVKDRLYSNNQPATTQVNKKLLTDKTMSDGMTEKQSVDRETILAFKKLKGDALRKQYGAHSLGIGWQRVEGKKTDQLALVFYVESSLSELASTIPAAFQFVPEGEELSIPIPTTVVETSKPVEENLN